MNKIITNYQAPITKKRGVKPPILLIIVIWSSVIIFLFDYRNLVIGHWSLLLGVHYGYL